MAKSPSISMAVPSKNSQEKWEVEDALRTLTRSQEIEKDASMMKRVRKMAEQKSAEMEKVADGLNKRALISDRQREKIKNKGGKVS